MLSGNGPCFAERRGGRQPTGLRTPAAFEDGLLRVGHRPDQPRPCRPQTNGKLERLHASIEAELPRCGSLDACVKHCNCRRLHFSLDMKTARRPKRSGGLGRPARRCAGPTSVMEEERE